MHSIIFSVYILGLTNWSVYVLYYIFICRWCSIVEAQWCGHTHIYLILMMELIPHYLDPVSVVLCISHVHVPLEFAEWNLSMGGPCKAFLAPTHIFPEVINFFILLRNVLSRGGPFWLLRQRNDLFLRVYDCSLLSSSPNLTGSWCIYTIRQCVLVDLQC